MKPISSDKMEMIIEAKKRGEMEKNIKMGNRNKQKYDFKSMVFISGNRFNFSETI